MPTDLEKLHDDDLHADLACAIEQQGARHFLAAFKAHYPMHYEEMVAQYNHQESMKKVPMLFKPRAVPV